MLETFLKDLRHSLRMFAQSPVFTAAAVAALTLGIGANTAIFSVVNAVLLKPVSFPDPDRVVVFMNTSPQGSGPAASPAKFMHYRRQDAVVQDVAAFNSGSTTASRTAVTTRPTIALGAAFATVAFCERRDLLRQGLLIR